MNLSRSKGALPLAVRRSLAKLGADIAVARKRRRLPMALVAERAFIGRNTLTRIERGDPGVSIGIYATVLFVLGLADRIGALADPLSDIVGQTLEHERLPVRTHSDRPTDR
jgi:transcriptional regulator with XRE-family HTH domain